MCVALHKHLVEKKCSKNGWVASCCPIAAASHRQKNVRPRNASFTTMWLGVCVRSCGEGIICYNMSLPCGGKLLACVALRHTKYKQQRQHSWAFAACVRVLPEDEENVRTYTLFAPVSVERNNTPVGPFVDVSASTCLDFPTWWGR